MEEVNCEAGRLLAAAGQDGKRLPVVVTADGDPLVDPSDAELAARVGLTTHPSTDFYDLVVVGGGPAGLGAAVYGGSEGLRTVLVERLATGGQAGMSSRIENYLGFPDGVSGGQLTERARRQALKFDVELLTTRDVVAWEAPVITMPLPITLAITQRDRWLVPGPPLSYAATAAANRSRSYGPSESIRRGHNSVINIRWATTAHQAGHRG